MPDSWDDATWDRLGRIAEEKDATTQTQILEWLYRGDTSPHRIKDGFEHGVQQYKTVVSMPPSTGIRRGAERLANAFSIRDEVTNSTRITERRKDLPTIRSKIVGVEIPYVKSELNELVNSKEAEIYAQEQYYVDIIKTTSDVRQFENARGELRNINPQVLGGIKSGQVRRGAVALREMFKQETEED